MRMKKPNYDPKITKFLKNKKILVSGGAGSIGSALIKNLLEYSVNQIRVLDIDEHALFKLKHAVNDSRLRMLLGSILDKDRIQMAGNDVDIIIHTAAIKNIEISEYNPIETIETNIHGTVNMIKMAMQSKPKLFINLSTDKAVDSSTLYGTTKQLTERLTSWAGVHSEKTKFATIRFGNVMDSRGNVFEIWNEESKKKKPVSITHPLAERYFFQTEEATNFILKCLPLVNTGEIFVPKMKLYKIKDLAKKYSKKYKIIGLRQGEKIKEDLITQREQKLARERKDMWIISSYIDKQK